MKFSLLGYQGIILNQSLRHLKEVNLFFLLSNFLHRRERKYLENVVTEVVHNPQGYSQIVVSILVTTDIFFHIFD